MSLYGDAIAALRGMVLIDEWVQTLAAWVERLADHVQAMSERRVRVETIPALTRRACPARVALAARRADPADPRRPGVPLPATIAMPREATAADQAISTSRATMAPSFWRAQARS